MATYINITLTNSTQGEAGAAESAMFLAYVERQLAADYPAARIGVEQNDRISSTEIGVSDDLDINEIRGQINRYWDSGDWYVESAAQ